MKLYKNLTLDAERALYGEHNISVESCRFDGPLDGESAIKECREVKVSDSYFNLRYPFWHTTDLAILDSELTALCRAALWYSENVDIKNSKLHGIKALRECRNVTISQSSVISAEFGWFSDNVTLTDSNLEGEYVFLRTSNIKMSEVKQKGKYSFQYIENSTFENCNFDTKDAFWHAKNVTVRNSVIKGEYLAWYSEGLTLENCTVIGTQPLCYAKGLRLINCRMIDADLSFERSEVEASLTEPIISIKNPLSGTVTVPLVKEMIFDDKCARGIVVTPEMTYKNSLK